MKNFSYFPGNTEIIINGKNNECETSNVTRVKASIKMLNKFVDEVHERMIIHTNHAVNEGHKQIKIIGEDSDCVALLLQNWKTWATQGLKELWYEYTCGYKKKVIGIHILAEKLPPELLLTIVAVHNLTGSLYTSRIGTKQAAINNNPMEYLSIFGKDPTGAEMEKSFVLAENYLVKLLKKNYSCQNFNELRYWEYHHGSSFSIQNLPATSASIRLHILRAWYITYKQLNLLNYFYQVHLNFTNFGYEIIKNEICPKKIQNLFPSIDDLVPACSCIKCSTKSCRCIQKYLKCTSFCKCSTNNSCQNPHGHKD